MIQNENRRLAAAALGNQIIKLALSHTIPSVGGEAASDSDLAPGAHIGRQVGLALIAVAKDSGLNVVSILDGLGLAYGEALRSGVSAADSLEALVGATADSFEQALCHTAGVNYADRSLCAECGRKI